MHKILKAHTNTLFRYCAFFLLLGYSLSATAQNLSGRQADSLVKKLPSIRRDTERFSVPLRLAKFQVFKPGEFKTDLDSAAAYIAEASRLKNKVHTPESEGIFSLINFYWSSESGKKAASAAWLEKAIGVFSKCGALSLLGEAYLQKGYSYDMARSNIGPKIQLTEMALAAYTSTGNKIEQANCLTLLSDLRSYYNANDDKALEEINNAFRIRKALGQPSLQVYIMLARIYSGRANLKKALEAALTALTLAATQSENKGTLTELYNHTGLLYYRLLDDDHAIYYWNMAVALIKTQKGQPELSSILYNITSSLNRQGRSGEALRMILAAQQQYSANVNQKDFFTNLAVLSIYTSLKRYPEAKKNFDQISSMLSGKEYEGYKWNSYTQMIKYCFSSRRYGSADSLLKLNHEVAKNGGDPEDFVRNYTLWFTLDTIRKDFTAATYHLLKAKVINDSLSKKNETRALKELEIQYETEKKENNLKLQRQQITVLNQRQTLQESRLQRANLLRNITIAGICCLIIFAALLFQQLRDRKEANRLAIAKNKQLEHLLCENEWLLKEVHHRVKNNLQLITGLLNSQSIFLQDGAALNAIKESQRRVQSMAIIHQKLYKASNYSSIYMPEYVRDLVEYLESSFSSEKRIYFQLEIDAIHLDIANAIPVGLIVNESVTNAIKYAFPEEGEYAVKITLARAEKEVKLIIADNGKGLPDDFDTRQSSFGLLLMKGLSEEMSGNFHISSNHKGTVICVSFAPSLVRTMDCEFTG